MKICRLCLPQLLLFAALPLAGRAAALFPEVTPLLQPESLLKSLDGPFDSFNPPDNELLDADGLRDVFYFTYLASNGATSAVLADLLQLPSTAPLAHPRARLGVPGGVASHGMWIQYEYPWLKSFEGFLRANMPSEITGTDFNDPSLEIEFGGHFLDYADTTRLVFAAQHESQLDWRDAPIHSAVTPGFFLQRNDNGYGYEEKGVPFLSLVGNYLYNADEERRAIGIPLDQDLTLFVITPFRGQDQESEYAEPDHLKLFLQDFDLTSLKEIRSTMSPRLVEARLPVLAHWDVISKSFPLPHGLGQGADFSNFFPQEGAYAERIQQFALLAVSETGVARTSTTALRVRLPVPPAPGSPVYGSVDYGVISSTSSNVSWTGSFTLSGVAVGYPLRSNPPLPLEFAADQPFILIVADDHLQAIHSMAIVREIPEGDQLRNEDGSVIKTSWKTASDGDGYSISLMDSNWDWTASAWFGWILTNDLQNLRPWYYHATHGWIYLPEGVQASGTWWWDAALGWSYASATSPYIYSADQGWLWLSGGNAGERVFYSYSAGDWVFE